MIKLETIKTLEELQLNNWQPLQTMLLDGWILRFANGYSKRANSINPLYHSTGELNEKISECEKIYQSKNLRPTFKISPAVFPINLETALEQKGYSLIDRCSVQVLQLNALKEPNLQNIKIAETVTDDWLNHYCRLANATDSQKIIMKQMFANIRTKAAFISLYYEGTIVACGIGIIERQYIGLWDIITDVTYRNRGLGEQMLLNLLKWGKENGARNSYLVVVADNAPALKLYSKLGFEELYQHWYRIKEDNKIEGE